MQPHVVVVDDDAIVLKRAWSILSEAGMKVAILKSGGQLRDYLNSQSPDLILLDINMPDQDGFEVLLDLKKTYGEDFDIPVIFLTANEDEDAETRGLSLGAMDYIRKPFAPNILILRVKHAIELVRLQKHLSSEVKKKTKEVEQLYLDVVSSLADSIDAKDNYTNGHSRRVAKYSKEIAARYGYSKKAQEEIYMMGLLHDVGKIGVPDSVINKTASLTDEEFKEIQKHPVIGGKILGNIKGMPTLLSGARYHHERYDGSGYPEGLVGNDIPEAARIIAVADAYDAMSSNRSYRKSLSQKKVRQEIEKGKGTQFDPVFADIMLAMIDEDTGYDMRDTLAVHSAKVFVD